MKEVKGENEELICNAISNMKELYEYLKERINKEGMDELYYEVEHPLNIYFIKYGSYRI